jgi:hypothetical protein
MKMSPAVPSLDTEILPEAPAHRRLPLAAWMLSIVGIAPYLLIGLVQAQWTPQGYVSTGAVQYDEPYYYANGRAIFERGNGLAYPNPYDPDPTAPVIYCQWFIWLIGFSVKVFHVNPAVFNAVVGTVAAVVFARLTLALVDRCTGGAGFRVPLFLLAMWGGGIAVLLNLALCLKNPAMSFLGDPLRFEPFGGWWMLPWGRNSVYMTESLYHVLMAGAWLCALDRRWKGCFLCLFLIASTHPFTGIEALGIFLVWGVLGRFRWWGGRVPAGFLGAVFALTAAFLGYYFGFLSRHPQHRALQEHWEIPWVEGPWQTVAAYGLVAIPAFLRLARDRFRLGLDQLLLLSTAVVAFGLSHHDWLVKPRQPLHFSHGYVWIPLFLLGEPVLRDALAWAWKRPVRTALVGLVGVLACVDNFAWVAFQSREILRKSGALSRSDSSISENVGYIPEGLARAYREIDARGLRGVLLCDDPTASYLAATFTGCRPYYGHMYNTPDFDARRRRVAEWFASGRDDGWMSQIDLVLARGDLPESVKQAWKPIFDSGGWKVYERPR